MSDAPVSAIERLSKKNIIHEKIEGAVERNDLVFGLDIGTRNVVGIIGYKTEKGFHIIYECSMVHDTRAMLDGQIHDIKRVGDTCRKVKEQIENALGITLHEVCIAAAGRVLRTVTTRVEYDYPEETYVTGEDLNTLDLMGIDQAEKSIINEDKRFHFFCVGYSVVRYFLDGEPFSYLEGHKANKIEEDIIVTFLPEDVVNGLYAAVEIAGLEVRNLTLEPIAAMDLAVPENFRMLNIGLVDVGAGTSDICITKDGSIIAYGMIPHAGDELSEAIVQAFLVDFQTAEDIKIASTSENEIKYKDIMGIEHTAKPEEIWAVTDPIMEKITDEVASEIKELNGGKSVAATFVVGGGGKVHGFCERLSDKLGIIRERVALRGEEVMQNITFEQKDVKKDPLLVTPIGICLNFYEQQNSFIMVLFNGERLKLYDNGKLKVVDAALAGGFPTEDLFPKRGKALTFTVDGKERIVLGEQGEPCAITLDGSSVSMNASIHTNAVIEIKPSTAGADAKISLSDIDEFKTAYLDFFVNSKKIMCPKFFEVNGNMQGASYVISEGDRIETKNFYTVGQIASFMDVKIDPEQDILVNTAEANLNTPVYENFDVQWTLSPDSDIAESESVEKTDSEKNAKDQHQDIKASENNTESQVNASKASENNSKAQDTAAADENTKSVGNAAEGENAKADDSSDSNEAVPAPIITIHFTVNDEERTLSDQSDYIFTDIFRVYDFDTNDKKGSSVITEINGKECGFTEPLKDGDKVRIYWK